MKHHELGRTQLYNIHDRDNLVALCSICHFALDSNEWTFIPEDTKNWIQRIEATPRIIQEYNSQRNIVFRRLLLIPDPDSKAFQDNYYKSAFTDSPTKIWSGEPGVVVISPLPAPPPEPTAELQETFNDFRALQMLWLTYKSPCSEEKCPICQSNNEGEDSKGDGEEDSEEDSKEDSEEDSKEDSKEDEEGDKDFGRSWKRRKGIFKRQTGSTGQQPPLQDFDTKKLSQAKKYHQKPKNTERDWMTSAPYDKSIPYSHRYGYTWAGSTSNDLMRMWQAYRKPVEQ